MAVSMTFVFTIATHFILVSTSKSKWTCPKADHQSTIGSSMVQVKRRQTPGRAMTLNEVSSSHSGHDGGILGSNVVRGHSLYEVNCVQNNTRPLNNSDDRLLAHPILTKTQQCNSSNRTPTEGTRAPEPIPSNKLKTIDLAFVFKTLGRKSNMDHPDPVFNLMLLTMLILVPILLFVSIFVFHGFDIFFQDNVAEGLTRHPSASSDKAPPAVGPPSGASSAAVPHSATQLPSNQTSAKTLPKVDSRHRHNPYREEFKEGFSAFKEGVEGLFRDKKVLCSELVHSSEKVFAVKCMNDASPDKFAHDVRDSEDQSIFHVRLRPGRDEGSESAGGPVQPDAEVLELLSEEQGHLLAFCCMPSHDFIACADICDRRGKIFGQVSAELEYQRFVLAFPKRRKHIEEQKWILTGDFAKHQLRIASQEGKPIAWTDCGAGHDGHRLLFAGHHINQTHVKVSTAPDVDAGLVACFLLLVDRTFGVRNVMQMATRRIT